MIHSILFAREENSDECGDQDNRRHSDKQPFKGVERHSQDSGFRVTVIPAQIRTVYYNQAANITRIMAHMEISSQRMIALLMVFLCASCKLITSNFSEMAVKWSASVSTIVSPNNVLTGVSSASDRAINRSESGTDSPVSHS